MTSLSIQNIHLAFADKSILKDANFSLQGNEVACLLGESGCGKTTLLRVIAGLETPSSGSIELLGETLQSDGVSLAVEKRNIGIVFQDYALFPHLTVRKNIAFGLNKTQRKSSIVDDMLELVGLTEHAEKYPHQLSGGQQQRVAIARAIAPQPKLLLLDEPFSHLDVHLREQLAHDLRHIIKRQGIMALLVTHDQQEAFAFSDKIGVMHEGSIEQWGTAGELYQQPQTAYVASFIGEGALISAEVSDKGGLNCILGHIDYRKAQGSDAINILVRPDALSLKPDGAFAATVIDWLYRGSSSLIKCHLDSDPNKQQLLVRGDAQDTFSQGQKIRLQLNHDKLRII